MQSIAGATSTATHGTGVGFGNLATTIVGLEIVTGDGTILRADEEHDPSCFVLPEWASVRSASSPR